jgi:hypothetical protein
MTVDDLERCIGILLTHARARGVDELTTTHDYYWDAYGPERFVMLSKPQLLVGSIDDDLAELEALLRDPWRATSVDLDRAAAALRLIGDLLSKP